MMYRIFCESYENFLNSFNEEKSSRLEISKPLELITNIDKYNNEKEKNSKEYKKISDLVFAMQNNIKKFPKFKAFLWTLKSRNINGKRYGVETEEEIQEQMKLVNSFLNLAYWY